MIKSVLIPFIYIAFSIFFPGALFAQSATVSCPIPGGKITTPSFQADPVGGHCGGGYQFACSCNNAGRRAKAIDVGNTGSPAILPEINGQKVDWTLITKNYSVAGGEGGGAGNTFKAQVGSDTWYLDILHLNATNLQTGQGYPSGTQIASVPGSHAHLTVGKNLKGQVTSGTSSDCDPGWLASDFVCNGSSAPTGSNPNASSSTSSTFKSNVVCTKVGNASEESKPAVCKGVAPAGNFKHFCQGDPKWDDRGACGTGQIGCGPTSLAMIFNYFGNATDPAQMFQSYNDNNLLSCGVGSFPDRVVVWADKQGFEVGPNIGAGKLDAELAKKYISEGYLILGSSNNFRGQRGGRFGHIFVVQDVNPQAQTFTMRDPENCSYSTGQEIEANINQPIISDKIPSWVYAYPIKKK